MRITKDHKALLAYCWDLAEKKEKLELETGYITLITSKHIVYVPAFYIIFLTKKGLFRFVKHPFGTKQQAYDAISRHFKDYSYTFYIVKGREILDNDIKPLTNADNIGEDQTLIVRKYDYPAHINTPHKKRIFRKRTRRQLAHMHPLYKELMTNNPNKWSEDLRGTYGDTIRRRCNLRERIWSRLAKELTYNTGNYKETINIK